MLIKKNIKLSFPACLLLLFCSSTHAGIIIGGSRIVHTEGATQTTFSVKNDSEKGAYLIQSWVEKADGVRTSDFVVTPPIYFSPPGSENILRIIPVDPAQGLTREHLYYLSLKAVPAVDKETIRKQNSVVVATTMKIKLFVRPAALNPAREKAENLLRFSRHGGALDISNPTPYWLTLSSLQIGHARLPAVMIPPGEHKAVALPAGSESGRSVKWTAINDSGGADRGKSLIHHD